MSVQPIQPGLYRIRLPGVNAFLLDSDSDGLTLVDTGVPGSADRITDAVDATAHSLAGSPQRSFVSSDHRAKANSRSSCDNRRAGRRWA